MDTNKQVLIFGAIVLALIAYVGGFMTPRTSWETKYVPVEYDAVKNTEECAKAGGYITDVTVFATGDDIHHKVFICYIPARTIPFSQASSTIRVANF